MTDATNPIPFIARDNPAAGSGDVVADNVVALKSLFPAIVTDGKVDFDVLRQLLGDAVEDGAERYGLNWKGKARARAFALTPSLGTLRPAKADSKDWDTTRNIVIEGDNLEVLKLLRRSYAGRVKLIYIDPPYNTGNNLIYRNDFSAPLRAYEEAIGAVDADGVRFSTIKRDSGRFHTEWLNAFYPQVLLSRDLLKNDGVLVITIDENELHNVIAVCEDVYPKGVFDKDLIAIVHNPRGVQGRNLSYTHEYAVIVYRKDMKVIADRKIDDADVDWAPLRNWGGESERKDAKNCFYPILVEGGEIVGFGDVSPDDYHPKQTEIVGSTSYVYPIDRNGVERKWRYARQSVDSIKHMLRARSIKSGFDIELGKTFGLHKSIWKDTRYDSNGYGTAILKELVPDSPFDFPKSLWAVYDVIESVLRGSKSEIVLDFFGGSGTTGHAVMQLNASEGTDHRFLLVQIPEPVEKHARFTTIAELTEERLRRAGEKVKADNPTVDVDTGFRVYKLATSNLKPWQPGEHLAADLLDAATNVLPGRSEDDLLVELLLKTGIDLALPGEARTIAGCTVHSLGGGTLIVCLADVPATQARALGDGIADWVKELAPADGRTTFFFKDSGFDAGGNRAAEARANLAATIRQRLGDEAIEKLGAI
ncbi:DNA methyltransferase [uncultured Sphingomonas sp.]|jgi:adenine-specific DNA-methyltransferase|uniref:site-specific DNA-methyltransferase n=1 Tax=uncultured Sphingomonas sp. TaxID=158754 RepID=UPI0030D6FD01